MTTSTRLVRFRLGSLALICCSFFSTILLRAAVTTSTPTTSHSSNKVVTVIENEQVQMRLTLRQDSLDRVPSCQHTFSQVEVMNMHASDSVTINSIQTTPEETFLIRYDPNEQDPSASSEQQQHTTTATTPEEEEEDIFASFTSSSGSSSSSSSWDQRSIPQQIHTSSGQGGIVLEPGQVAIVPLAYLPRYPCTAQHNTHTLDELLLSSDDDDDDGKGSAGGAVPLLEDYWYAQQAPYQIAFSSTFDPDDENFSLAQPPPPKLTKVFSGTARADWEQLLKEMPPQERSNWLHQQQQQQQQQQQISGSLMDMNQPPLHPPSSSAHKEHSQQQQQSSGGDPSGGGNNNSNNLLDDWVFEVRTTVLLETTRGSVQLPVRASSRRQNAYGLPDVIYFDQETEQQDDIISKKKPSRSPTASSPQPARQSSSSSNNNQKKTKGVLWLDTDLAPAESRGDKESDYAEDDDDEISPSTSRNCYNVFMTNPSSKEDLLVADVAVSQPDRMNLQVHGLLRAPSSSVNQWWNTVPRRKDGDSGSGEEPPQLGSLVIAPGEQRYVVTVCTAVNFGSTFSPTAAPTPNANGDWLYGDDVAHDINNANIISVDSDTTSDDEIAEVVERAGKSAAQAGAKLAASAKYSMGFLRIKTETGSTLVVALERLRKQCQANTGAAGGANNGKSNQSQTSPSAAPSKQQQVYPPSYHHALYKVEMQPTEELAAIYGKAAVVPAPATPLVTSALKSIPARLDFSLLSSSSPTVVSYLGIYNPKDYPIKIMRSGVAVEIEDELDSTQPNPEDLGLHMSVKIKNNYLEPETTTEEALMITCSINWDKFQAHNLESLFFHGNAILRATAHVNFNYNQWIKNLVNTNSKIQQGKVLITNDYADPKNTDGSEKQTEFVLEIPLSVSMVQGKIGIMIHRTSHPFPHLWAVQSWKEGLGSVSSIFYPQKPFDIRAELDSGEGPLTEPIFGQDGIDHKLRIFANINIPSRVGTRDDYEPQSLQLASATVLDEDPIVSSSNNETAQAEDICGRFNVSVGPPPADDFPFQGFNDVGLVHIEYRFPDPEDIESDESEYDTEETELPAYPKYCYLSLTTDPFTELHQIPLIVYPGQTEITATQTPSYPLHRRNKNKKKKRKKSKSKGKDTAETLLEVTSSSANSHAVVGFDSLVEWFQTSRVGSSLRSYLEDTSGSNNYEWAWNKRGGDQDDEHLLGKYVASLCGKSLNLRTAHLRPILLKVGAIRHGTVESSSFYMTNHNPIPLLVSVDVGEVEGMSISLARAPTRGQGDGHNILDHFPKKRNNAIGGPYQHLVPSGEFQGHPLEGLRKFLRTTDVAQEFLSLFKYRDAISLSDRAIDRQPLLDTLYKKYAFGEFHRDPLPIRFGQDGWSRCRRRMRSPLSSRQFVEPGYDYNATTKDGDEDEDTYWTEESMRAIKAGRGPLMISDDFKQPRPLKVCWDKDAEPTEYPSDGTYTIVPPGAIARFELKLHAPPKSMLRDDITRFLSTGLVLSTDHGEILPIFVSFEALLGEVQIAKPKPTPSSSRALAPSCAQPTQKLEDDTSAGNATVMQVPANLFHEVPRHLPVNENADDVRGANTTNHDRALSLRLKSSFSSGTRLVGVSSCNPWFEVALDENEGSLPFLPGYREAGYQQVVEIGEVKSTISCETGRNYLTLPKYPSFYQCALKWLSDQPELQPRGCGVLPSARKMNSNEESNVGLAEHSVIRRAVKACEKALLVSSLAFGGGFPQDGNESATLSSFDHMEAQRQLPPSDGVVAPLVLDVFAEAWDAWRVVADYGLRKLSSTLKATIEYESAGSRPGDPSKTQNLTVSMRNTTLQTVLSAPKLFDCQRAANSESIFDSTIGDDYSPSVVEFKPTPVADFSSLTIPLKNPTAVPVRVRIATAPPSANKENAASTEPESLKNRFSVDDDVRNSFMESSSPPFVQNGKLNTTTQHYHAGVSAEQLWWDGAGGYFLADEYGDLVRSHHNIRIMAGGGAHVSMVNPSLHSNVAVLVGCGVRCGVRHEKDSPLNQDANDTSKLVSPIGASAAAGITLSGRVRSTLPQVNVRVSEEPIFAAGAASPGENGGPAAFAIPYSSLDEIIIPPFGEVEIGPILFRPPGRHSVHGCQAAADSRIVSISGNGDRSKACSSNIYESMVYLENSLTGLERLTLRGRALWERLAFLDPPPADAHLGDEFGDIELRYGYSALMFSGSKASDETHSHKLEPTVPGSVIKEVVVHNLGDTLLDFESAYLSDTSKLQSKHSAAMSYRQHDSICSFKQFRLLNCFDEDNEAKDEEGLRNVKNGFTLEPGESISLFIEHFPDCKKAHEFIALNLERRRNTNLNPVRGRFGLLSSEGQPGEKSSNVVFRRRKFELLIGYEMSDEEFKSCVPVQLWSYKMSAGRCSAGSKGCKASWFSEINHRLRWYSMVLLRFVILSGCILFSYAFLYRGFLYRHKSAEFFASNLTGGRRKTNDNGASEKPATQPGIRGSWAAAFRCLARADPSSADLQALGREQIRHVLLGRYGSMGILSPQCLSSNGVFNRERGAVVLSGSPTRQIGGKEVGSGDRARTLSDVIFRHVATHQDPHLRNSLPRGLAWRAAAARGMKLPNLSEISPRRLRTTELHVQRVARAKNQTEASDEEVEEDDVEDYQQERSNQSSYDGSQRSDDLSEAEYTDDDDDDGDESQNQESFVSELSEDQGQSESPDDTSDDRTEPVEEMKVETDNKSATTEGVAPSPPAEGEGEGEDEAQPIEDAKTSEKPEATAAESPEEEEKKLPEATNGADREETAALATVEMKTPPRQTSIQETASANDTVSSSQPPKTKDSKSTRRTRQQRDKKARAQSPFKADDADGASATTPQPKQRSQSKDAKAKPADFKTPSRPTKGSKATAEKAKQGGKPNQSQREKKINPGSPDPKTNKPADGEEKISKRRNKKNDPSGAPKQNTKDTAAGGKGSQNEKKAKGSAGKKGKKGRSSKATAQGQAENREEGTPMAAETMLQSNPSQTKPSETKPPLRPPPGLAPPPGFGAQDGAASASPLTARPTATFGTPLLPPSAFLSDTSILGSPSSTVLGTPARSLADNPFGGGLGSPSLLNPETPLRGVASSLPQSAQSAAGEALLASVTNTPLNSRPLESSYQSSTEGFDVMDFLDSILNDGAAATPVAPAQGPDTSFLSATGSGAATPVPPPMSSAPLQPLFSSDPWATERPSRASAYGIAIDEAANREMTSPSLQSLGDGSNMDNNPPPLLLNTVSGGSNEEGTINPIPLLNTASILYASDIRDDDDDDEEDNGDSFYAGLLAGLKTEDEEDKGSLYE